MGLCSTKEESNGSTEGRIERANPAAGKPMNRGRVRRLSLVTTEPRQGGGAGPSAEAPATAGPKGKVKAGQRRRLSLISGDLGGDAGFDCNASNITFYDGAQIDDSGALKMAGQGESELADVEPPAWLTYGAFTRAGHDGIARKTNQDAYVVCPHLLGESEQFLFGVFDGHGTEGHFVSRAVTRLLPKHVTTKLEKAPAGALKASQHGAALKHGFVQTEDDLFASAVDTTLSGTTAVAVLLRGRSMLLANTGDSRAVLGRREGHGVAATALTKDHKPEDGAERARIERMHGTCQQMYDPEFDEFIGPVRVWSSHYDGKSPGIAMSRSIGDMVATEVGVISEPDITSHDVDLGRDAVLIIASDGVWEFMSDQDAVDLAMQHEGRPRDAAVALCQESLRRWREEEEVVDDITAVVLFFRPEEAVKEAAAGGATPPGAP